VDQVMRDNLDLPNVHGASSIFEASLQRHNQ
jgi:hypothetical protein